MSIVVEPGGGKKLEVLGLQFPAKVGANDAVGAFALNEVSVSAEAPPVPVHTHATERSRVGPYPSTRRMLG